MQLTKEQLDEIEEHASNMKRDDWNVSPVGKDELKEFVRGYRAYLAEVEHHKQEENKCAANIKENGDVMTPHSLVSWNNKLKYHRARLAALKGEG